MLANSAKKDNCPLVSDLRKENISFYSFCLVSREDPPNQPI